ncbi:uncharacterized protein MELLADRAFT_113897 [Melampsora larici-populina 98AG31]|uniref:Uncharacterized protein n=1 Tax=Melampsora larici-populina (strain 98AG31 / pathotype 3-4-7) TaxID=747676 RepID=F4SBG8_MELLP|nr:uncharacterized protein MELLADRAFT_113897 [Melampsora larici-populina 98AG31]EGF98009.1 hypothetical protein MELLADRAFT_113897 [Melampsora larici-populina 98AG31]
MDYRYITHNHRLIVKPLPLPIVGKLSGLSCPLCPSNGGVQLRYQNPFPLKPANIAWKHVTEDMYLLQCHQAHRHPGNEGYVRTLVLEKLIQEIRAKNREFQLCSLPRSLAAIISVPDYNTSTSQIASSTSKPCPGLNGQFGQTHRSTSNAKCTYQLCISCCKLGQSQGQSICVVTSHRYQRVVSLEGISSNNPISTTRLLPAPPSLPPPSQPSQVQSAQANRAVTAKLSQSQLTEYHSNLKDAEQAAKRKKLAEEEQMRRLTIEFWPKAGDSILIRTSAKDWPFFALGQGDLFLFEGHNSGVDNWESMVMVWNTSSKRWVRISLHDAEKYPKVPRKLLIRLSVVNEDECTGLENAKADVNTEGPYESLSMPLTWNALSSRNHTPTRPLSTGNSTNHTPSGPTQWSPFPRKSETPIRPNPSQQRSSSIDSDVVFMGSKNNQEERRNAEPKALKTWPDSGVLLSQALKWHYNIFDIKNIRKAWDLNFGEIYKYGQATAYRVDDWIFIVGAVTLTEVVKATPLITLKEARKTYAEEWKQARESKRKYCGANEGEKRKRCGDSGSAVSRKKMRHNETSTDSSDVEVVYH